MLKFWALLDIFFSDEVKSFNDLRNYEVYYMNKKRSTESGIKAVVSS